jgi:hypothetical protein
LTAATGASHNSVMTANTRRLAISLDPLMAEARRRMRQRRLLVAALLVALAAGAAATTLALRGPSTASRAKTGPNHSYPLGTPVTWYHPSNVSWRMTVNSAIINASAQVEAVNGNVPPSTGQQYTLVNLTVTRLNGGPVPINYLIGGLLAGRTLKGWAVPDQSCTPPSHDLRNAGAVSSGQTETGNLCFLNFTSEASKLMLTALDERGVPARNIWFALH